MKHLIRKLVMGLLVSASIVCFGQWARMYMEELTHEA